MAKITSGDSSLNVDKQNQLSNVCLLVGGLLVMLIGWGGIIGYMFNIPWLRSYSSEALPLMRLSTAITLLFLGSSMALHHYGTILEHDKPLFPRLLSFTCLLISGIIIFYFASISLIAAQFNILVILAAENPSNNMMPFLTVTNLLFCWLAYVAFRYWGHIEAVSVWAVSILSLLSMNLSIFIITAYELNLPVLSGTSTAIPSTLAFILIGATLLISSMTRKGLLGPLLSTSWKIRLLGLSALALDFIVLGSGIIDIQRFQVFYPPDLSIGTEPVVLLYLGFELTRIVLAVSFTTLALRTTNYLNESTCYAQQQEHARSEAEEALNLLKDKETILGLLLASSWDAVVTIDEQARILSFNPSAVKLFGYQPEEVVGQNVNMLMPNPYQEEHDTYIENYLKTGVKKIIGIGREVVALRKDGSVVDVELQISEIKLKDKRIFVGFFRDITIRKQAEEQRKRFISELEQKVTEQTHELQQALVTVQESEERFRTLADQAPLIIWMSDETGRSVFANQCWYDVTGQTAEENAGFGWVNVIHPEDRDWVFEKYNQIVQSRLHLNFEYRLKRADGEYRWVIADCIPRYEENQEFLGFIGTLVDITERRQVEQQLRESESKFRQVMISNLIGIVFWNTEGYITQANDAFLDIIGYQQADVQTGTFHWPDITPEEYHSIDEHALQEIQETGRCTPFEKQYAHKDGHRVDVIVAAALLEGSNTEGVAIIIDITKRKQAEAELLKVKSFLDTIIEAIPHMIFMKDAKELRFVKFNKAGEDLTGYPRQEMIGKNDYNFFPKEQADFFTEKDRIVLNGQVLLDIPEEAIQTATRGVRWLHTKKVPLLDAEGTPQFLLGVSEDITEKREVQKKVEGLTQALEQKVISLDVVNKELESFSYSVSHDLRAPLRSIDGFSQALLEDYQDKLDETGKQYLKFLRDSSQEMAKLIDDLLSLSRLTRGSLNIETVNITQLAHEIAHELTRLEPQRTVEFNIEDELLVRGDKRLLEAALRNLIGNAWKFTSNHSLAHIQVGSMPHNGQKAYFIKDDGAGFDMAFADKLFVAFHRLHSAQEFPGTGIGLATVARIIHRHGGEIWAEGAVEQGATFYFTLPEALAVEATREAGCELS